MKVSAWSVRLMIIGVMPAALLAWPGPAAAHLVQTGFGSFYDGAAHVLFSPEDLLLLIALGLLVGLRGRGAVARNAVLVLPLAWGCGLLIGSQAPIDFNLTRLSPVSYGVIGALAAFNLALSGFTITFLTVLFGLLHGYINGAALALPGVVLFTAGILSAVMTLLLLCAALVASLRRQWLLIAARVAGSWLAAVSMLMAGWMARY